MPRAAFRTSLRSARFARRRAPSPDTSWPSFESASARSSPMPRRASPASTAARSTVLPSGRPNRDFSASFPDDERLGRGTRESGPPGYAVPHVHNFGTSRGRPRRVSASSRKGNSMFIAVDLPDPFTPRSSRRPPPNFSVSSPYWYTFMMPARLSVQRSGRSEAGGTKPP